MPPFVAARALPKLVPPEKGVTAMRLSLHALRMREVSCVVWGKKTIRGVCCGGAGDQGVLDLLLRVVRSRVWEMLWGLSSERRLWMLRGVWS
jgi:hypothetical protein